MFAAQAPGPASWRPPERLVAIWKTNPRSLPTADRGVADAWDQGTGPIDCNNLWDRHTSSSAAAELGGRVVGDQGVLGRTSDVALASDRA